MTDMTVVFMRTMQSVAYHFGATVNLTLKPQLHIHDFGHGRTTTHSIYQVVMHRHESKQHLRDIGTSPSSIVVLREESW